MSEGMTKQEMVEKAQILGQLLSGAYIGLRCVEEARGDAILLQQAIEQSIVLTKKQGLVIVECGLCPIKAYSLSERTAVIDEIDRQLAAMKNEVEIDKDAPDELSHSGRD